MKKLNGLCGKVLLSFAVFLATTGCGLFGAWSGPGDTALAAKAAPVRVPDDSEKGDKTLSPYFFVKSDSSETDQLPLKSTSATAQIAGVIADVRVKQVYKNEGKSPIEAIYVFPASTRAAVYGMKMTIGERTIVAKINEREKARADYEQAKREGKSASLLEQQRPNVFQMNVANIMPGDEIVTELSYTELLIPTDGVYEFVYPTVVGPRYSNLPEASAPPSEKWVQNPYLHEKEAPTYTFNITTQLNAGMPIQDMTCSSHKVNIRYEDKTRAVVDLAPEEKSGGNRDYILKYRLTGEQIDSGLLLYEGEGENFFLLMAQPPKRVAKESIPPREYIFIVDVSGSMNGFPIDISKRLLKDLIGGLRHTDTFNVLLFAGGSQLMDEKSIPATPENVRRAIDLIERQRGGGGTELLPALRRALALPRTEGVSRTMVIATDGYVRVETEAFDLIRKEIGKANFFTFGIGSSVNRFLLEGMARAGSGEPFVITKPDEAPAKAEKFRQYVQSPVLTGIKLDFGGFQAYDAEPEGVPDMFAERPVTVFGKWRGKPSGKMVLRGKTGTRDYDKTIDVSSIKPLPANSALKYLWARARIAELGDYNQLQRDDRRVREITDLGLKYNLLTAYTSFVAIDTQVRNVGGKQTTVQQPLPMPEGVSDLAVAGAPVPAGGMFMRKSAPQAPATTRPAEDHSVMGFGRGSPQRELGAGVNEVESEPKKERDRDLRISRLSVSAGLTEDAVRKVVERHLKEIGACFVGAAEGAEIEVKWTITASGKVVNVKVVSGSSRSADMEKCLAERIGKWKFQPPEGGGEVTVTVTFRT